jgi:hypothetical protein
MIRPVLEYCSIIYDNSTFGQKNNIEKIQRRAGIICTCANRHTEHQTLLRELCWESLSLRRKNQKLIQYYKLLNNPGPQYIKQLIPNPVSSHTTYRLRNRNRLRVQQTRLSSSYKSYFPSATRLWNQLPVETQLLPTLLSFKHKINKKTKQPHYHSLCSGRKGIWLTRLRLGLSALNAHRFKYNLIPSPNCNHCQTSSETTKHYFFACQAYQRAQQRLMAGLRLLGFDTQNKTQLLKYIIHGTRNKQKNTILITLVHEFMANSGRFA